MVKNKKELEEKMRHSYRHKPIIRRRIPRPLRRGGRLLGLAGLAALGYTMLEKYQREQRRRTANVTVDVDPQSWQGG
jgi:hypothetical protein